MPAADKEKEEGFCRICFYWQETEKPFFENRPITILVFLIFSGLLLAGGLVLKWGPTWWIVVLLLGAFLPLTMLPFLFLPLGTVTIVEKNEQHADADAKIPLEKLSIMADGKRKTFKNQELPNQLRIYFWRRGIYPVLVLAKYQGEDEARAFPGELNFYEERTANVTIEVTSSSKKVS